MRIAQVIREGGGWGEITPQIINKGVGGREGALIRLAIEWAKLGHEVTNFVPTKKSVRISGEQITTALFKSNGFHEYVPFGLAKHMLKHFSYDAVVAWECPSVFGDEDIMDKQKVRLVHMQVAHLSEQGAAEQFSTGVVALSEWAKDFLVHDGLSMNGDKLYVRPNGVNIDSYPTTSFMDRKRAMNNFTVVYSSSPDRGLIHLLRMWPEIMKEYGRNSRLLVGYGVKRFTDVVKWSHNRIGEISLEIEERMKQPGVIDIGRVGQDQLARLQLKASAWLYPADTIQATETGCITAIENLAAGNPCVMTDADCLKDEFGEVSQISPLPFDSNDFLSRLAESTMYYDENVIKGRKFAESRDWKVIAPTWIDLFEENRSA